MAAYTTTVGGSTATMEYEKALSTSDTLVITAVPAVDVVKVKSVGGTVYGRRGSAPTSAARQTATDGSSMTFGRPPGTPGLWTVHCLASSGSTVTVSAEVDCAALGDAVGSGAVSDGSITTAKLADDAVTLAKIQNISMGKVLGRNTAGTGDVEELDFSATAGANKIVKADSSGKVDTWVTAGSTSAAGLVRLATDGDTTSGRAVQANDSRLASAAGAALLAELAASPVTVSSATATLAATTVYVEVTVSATDLTLPSATDSVAGHTITVHNATGAASLVQLIRAGSDTIDAATARAGLIPPGGMIRIIRVSSSAWTSSLSIDPREAMTYFEWLPDASSGNLSNVSSGFTQAGTAGAAVYGNRLFATESRSGSTLATGWTHGSNFYYSDGRPAFWVQLYINSPTTADHRLMVGFTATSAYSGTRGSWSDKGMVLQYEGGDSNLQAIVRDSANSVQDTGAALAAGHYSLLMYRDGSVARQVIYYSATDPTFAGVAPSVSTLTPSSWPSATTMRAQVYAAAASAWTGTIGVRIVAFGEMR